MSRAQRSLYAPTLRVFMLGPFRIERENQIVVLPRQKLEPLLVYLILHPQPHSREKLATLFWGDFPDLQARASLRTNLGALK
jgi:DNA-binding SARP family transcriptional activator